MKTSSPHGPDGRVGSGTWRDPDGWTLTGQAAGHSCHRSFSEVSSTGHLYSESYIVSLRSPLGHR